MNDFYDLVEQLPEAKKIRDMHPTDLVESRDKLSHFLCGWLVGPKLYREKYGPIKLSSAHAHLNIGSRQRAAWRSCMQQALEKIDVFLCDGLSFLRCLMVSGAVNACSDHGKPSGSFQI